MLLTYPGGKMKHIETFMKYMPKTQLIVSPFLGGGSFEFFLANQGYTVYASDHNPHLFNFYKCLKHNPHKLSQYVSHLFPMSRSKFKTILEVLRHVNAIPKPNYKLASLFFALNKSSFNGIGRNISQEKMERFNRHKDRLIQKIRTFHFPPTLHIVNVDYKILLKKFPHAFAFVDPPYVMHITHYGLKGGNETFDHVELSNILRARKSKWILTYNDVPYVRSLYKNFHVRKIDPTIGYSNVKGTRDSGYKQILITNF
jgi:DNA adenine methylase